MFENLLKYVNVYFISGKENVSFLSNYLNKSFL